MQIQLIQLRVVCAVAGVYDVATVGRKGGVGMGVLRRVDFNGAIFIGEWPGPVCAHARGLREGDGDGHANTIAGVKELQANVGKVGVGNHAAACAVGDGMPGVEAANAAFGVGVYVDGAHAIGPVGDRQFACAGYPGFVGDPFARGALIESAIFAAVTLDDPDAVGEGAGVEEQVIVVRAELQVGNGVALEDDLALARLGVGD